MEEVVHEYSANYMSWLRCPDSPGLKMRLKFSTMVAIETVKWFRHKASQTKGISEKQSSSYEKPHNSSRPLHKERIHLVHSFTFLFFMLSCFICNLLITTKQEAICQVWEKGDITLGLFEWWKINQRLLFAGTLEINILLTL